MFVLVDCNNFFVSCERIFNPSLLNKPVIVLSSNDGCVIARSNEAKALGIPMGIPFFKIKELVNKYQVQTLSSNFALYADISHRVMNLLKEFSPNIELYSVDEAFLYCPNNLTLDEFKKYAESIRNAVHKCLGIPVSIGIASTKTLAKAAIEKAKTESDNIFILQNSYLEIDVLLKKLKINDIWGIGRQYGKNLNLEGINSAFDLKNYDPIKVRKKYSIVLERIVRELNGLSCLPLNELMPSKKSIQVSKSLSKEVKTIESARQIIATHLSSLAEKLRQQKLYCSYISIYIASNRFKENYYANSSYKILDTATNLTNILLKEAMPLIDKIFKDGIGYKKFGVLGSDLVTTPTKQMYLIGEPKKENPKSINLCNAIDVINQRFGSKSIYFASCGINPNWKTNSLYRSQNYTTSWEQLKTVI